MIWYEYGNWSSYVPVEMMSETLYKNVVNTTTSMCTTLALYRRFDLGIGLSFSKHARARMIRSWWLPLIWLCVYANALVAILFRFYKNPFSPFYMHHTWSQYFSLDFSPKLENREENVAPMIQWSQFRTLSSPVTMTLHTPNLALVTCTYSRYFNIGQAQPVLICVTAHGANLPSGLGETTWHPSPGQARARWHTSRCDDPSDLPFWRCNFLHLHPRVSSSLCDEKISRDHPWR